MAGAKGKALVAMSGGVDSSVAAALLLREGYEVVGCFMRLGSPGEALDELTPYDSAGVSCDAAKAKIGHQGCCSINDAADARLVAAELGIPFYVCNFKKDFGRIIDYFVGEYTAGRTPNPCVRCNDWLKFGRLHGYAKQIDASFIASGHYARIGRDRGPGAGQQPDGRGGAAAVGPASPNGSARLLRGVDRAKDQSYVLFGTPRERLTEMLLPIGEFEKSEVRAMARRFGLPTFDKPDSQEICFVPDNDYAGLVERRDPGVAREGVIVDTHGNAVGSHQGQHRFTIGQRRGLNVAVGHPVYVVGKDPATNTVTIGSRDDLLSAACCVREANWLIDDAARSRFADWSPCLAQVRYGADAVAAEARLRPDADDDSPSGRRGAFEVRFAQPQEAVTPGQALVLYHAVEPDWVIGGGWIASTTAPRPR